MSMCKTTLASGQLLPSVHMEKSYLGRQGELPGVVQWVLRLSKLPRGNEKLMSTVSETMFTLYRIVKRSVAESVPDRASVHTRNAAFEVFSAPEQYCSSPLLKVKRSLSGRFLQRDLDLDIGI